MLVDVIMLSKSANQNIINMTQHAINSLHSSENDYEFRITLVESQSDYVNGYVGSLTVIPREEFNYNKFLNIGFEFVKKVDGSLADYVVVVNNDLIFQKNWFLTIKEAIEYNNLDSASPISPGWYTQTELEGKYIEGFEVGQLFCGWCLVFKKESLEKLIPFDEQFEFWCQDNDLAITMSNMGMKHALVGNSVVNHLANKSHHLVDGQTLGRFTNGMVERFHKKWG